MLKNTDTLVSIDPAPKPLGFWGSYRALQRNMLELIPEAAYRETFVRGGFGSGYVMLMDLAAIQHVLRDRHEDYPRPVSSRRVITPRDGGVHLATAEGTEWRRLRKLLAPTYAPRHLKHHSTFMTEAAGAMIARIDRQDGPAMDMLPIMQATTRDVMCDLLVSGKEQIDREAYTACIDDGVANALSVSILDLMGAPNWVPRPKRMFNRAEVKLNTLLDDVVAKRIAEGPHEKPDLLDLMIMASDAHSGERLSPAELRNNVSGSLYAGLETTALAVCWTLYLLATFPAIQERLAEEVRAVVGDGLATMDDVARLPYLTQVLKEAMRLYPPGAMLARQAAVDDEIQGHPIRKGTVIVLPTYAVHRHHLLWDAPGEFDPDRFSADRAAQYHDFAFMPFGGGPRICVAYAFAMVEIQLFLATLLTRYQFRLADGFVPQPRMLFGLHPVNGMQLVAARR